MARKISRRQFVKTTAGTVVGAGVLLNSGAGLAAGQDKKSKIIEVFSKNAVGKERKVDAQVVRKMVQSGTRALAGGKNLFAELFGTKDVVGLKINCLGRPRIHTHHELVAAFSEELKAAGVKPENIIVWDRFQQHMTDCGFKMNPQGPGVRVKATESYRGDDACLDDEDPYVCTPGNPEGSSEDKVVCRFSRIFTRECNKHINLAIMKDHGRAGVTLCLKNIAFGVCDNNRRFHGFDEIGPFISGVCAKKGVMDRFVLYVLDGLEGCYDGGPRPGSSEPIFTHNRLWLGFDPVAIDTLGARVIDDRRKQAGMRSLAKSGRPPKHIEMSARLGLNTHEKKGIDVEKIDLT